MSKSVNSALFSSCSIEAKVCLSYTFSTASASSQKSISKSWISFYYSKYKGKLSRYYCHAKCTIQCAVPHSDRQTSGRTELSVRKICCFLSLSIYSGSRSAIVSEPSCSIPWRQSFQTHWRNVCCCFWSLSFSETQASGKTQDHSFNCHFILYDWKTHIY